MSVTGLHTDGSTDRDRGPAGGSRSNAAPRDAAGRPGLEGGVAGGREGAGGPGDAAGRRGLRRGLADGRGVPGRRIARAADNLALGLLTLAATTCVSVVLVHASTHALLPLSRWATTAAPAAVLEQLLIGAVTAVGALVAAWYALSALVGGLCALTQLCGATWQAGEVVLRRHGAPGVARLVGAGAGAVLATGLSITPAQADPPEPTPEPTIAEDLTWAAATREGAGATDRPQPTSEGAAEEASTAPAPRTATRPAESAPAPSAARPAPSSDATPSADYVVQTGDTLWAIAAAHLGPGADEAQIAATWPRWYSANAEVIGADPDLILPGTALSEPD